MLTTKNLVNDHKNIDPRWVFEYYCKLEEKLKGQDIKILSIFNKKDKAPSMAIYYDKQYKAYRFKDFSSGNGGSHIDLIKAIRGVEFSEAVRIITEDYNEFILHNNGSYDIKEFKEQSKYTVTEKIQRSWNTKDKYFWTSYHIGTTFLNEYFIKPLESYTLSKEEDGNIKQVTIKGDYIYGYYTKDGDLYKIYQPKVRDRKYIKVKQYIQGSDQLKGHDCLIIASGIKDIGALYSLKLRCDYIAPDSENTMIPKELMIKYKKKYKCILVLFDNDEAGIKAMKKYRETYGLHCILITYSKDAADSIKEHGPKKILHKIVPIINAKLCE